MNESSNCWPVLDKLAMRASPGLQILAFPHEKLSSQAFLHACLLALGQRWPCSPPFSVAGAEVPKPDS